MKSIVGFIVVILVMAGFIPFYSEKLAGEQSALLSYQGEVDHESLKPDKVKYENGEFYTYFSTPLEYRIVRVRYRTVIGKSLFRDYRRFCITSYQDALSVSVEKECLKLIKK